jgi:hypothetical protein
MNVDRTSVFRAGIAFCMLAISAHGAFAQNVCTAEPTPDGFVALREAPSASARLIVQMHSGDMIVIDRHPSFPTGFVPVRSGQWFRASHYVGNVFPTRGDPEFNNVRRGWVHVRLVGECG